MEKVQSGPLDTTSETKMEGRIEKYFVFTLFSSLCFADSTSAARIRRKSFLTSGWTLSIFSTSTTKRRKCRKQAPPEMISQPCIVQTPWKSTSCGRVHACMKRYRTFPQEASWTGDQDALASEVAYNNIWIQFTYHLRMWKQYVVRIGLRVSDEMYYALGC